MDKSAKGIRVVIEGLDASDERLAHLSQGVQKAVLTEIARLDLFEGAAIRFPRDWPGLWIRELGIPELEQLGFDR